MSEFKKSNKAVEENDSEEENEDGEEVEEAVEEVAEDTSLVNPEVVIKYQEAAKIVNTVMSEIAAMVRSMLVHVVP
jgi:hypothetical protein